MSEELYAFGVIRAPAMLSPRLVGASDQLDISLKRASLSHSFERRLSREGVQELGILKSSSNRSHSLSAAADELQRKLLRDALSSGLQHRPSREGA